MPGTPVAIINNSLTPYRIHLHQRITRELPEVELWTLLTHDESNSPWALAAPREIRSVPFGEGQKALTQSDPRFALREWRKGGRILRWMRDQAIRAVVLGGYNDLGRLRIARWCYGHGVPCFLFADSNSRSYNPRGISRMFKSSYVSYFARLCRGVFVCGRLGQEYFLRYGVPVSKLYLFPYEPDYDLIRSIGQPQVDAVRARYGLDARRRYIIYSGRLSPEKRVDLAIGAFIPIVGERPDWDLVILGDGPLRASLQASVPARMVPRVHWLGFINDQSSIAALYRAGKALILPSDYEPWAVVVNEAIAAGLALVCSDAVGAAAELVRDGINGFIFPRGDLAALTARLRELTIPGRAEELTAAGVAVLADWRNRADPVEGLRKALRDAGLLGG
jgi:glycosyltransferase involved in cell wall biosynthesis